VRLLLTRPEPDAQRTAAALRGGGHIVAIAPLVRIEPVADVAIDGGPWAAILVTSANAARAIAGHARLGSLVELPVFAVGGRSAQAMRAAGFTDAIAAGGSVGDLARLVVARTKPGASLLYLAGEERSGDLAGDLRGQGFAVSTIVVYRAVNETILPPVTVEALSRGIDGVLHFSRRSAEAYVNAAQASGALANALRPVQFCLSAQIAEPLHRAGAATIRVAPQPTEVALIELIGSNSA
jgi:uroporphyrinogen-III synthase